MLSGVDVVLLGDFANCGSTQALFLASDPASASPDDMDVLALMDADMEAVHAKRHFTDKFLLTDFAQTHIDCWTSPKVCFHHIIYCNSSRRTLITSLNIEM